jgi:hypothetical protein
VLRRAHVVGLRAWISGTTQRPSGETKQEGNIRVLHWSDSFGRASNGSSNLPRDGVFPANDC